MAMDCLYHHRPAINNFQQTPPPPLPLQPSFNNSVPPPPPSPLFNNFITPQPPLPIFNNFMIPPSPQSDKPSLFGSQTTTATKPPKEKIIDKIDTAIYELPDPPKLELSDPLLNILSTEADKF